jgi:colicin import membrane protein
MDRALPSPADDQLRPQRPGGFGRGAALALLAHVGLIVALAIGVNWRASEPAATSAELWAQVPQAAAPRAVESPPPAPAPAPKVEPALAPKVEPAPPPPRPRPTEAEIALEAQKKKAEQDEARRRAEAARERERERERAEQDKRRQQQAEAEEKKKQAAAEAQRRKEAAAKAEKAEREAEEKKLAALREENLKRMQGLTGATGGPSSAGQAMREAGPSAGYAGRIIARIRPNIVLLDSVPGNPMAAVEVRAAPDGTIVGRRLIKSSGSAAWDEAVLRAIDRTEILPRDTDGRVPSPMTIEFRPKD